MKRAALAALLVATACVPVEAPREIPVMPPIAPAPPPPPPPPPEPPDYCGAKPLQYLVGKHRTEIPVPVNPSTRRVTCTTCPVTMDYSAYRLNIFYEQSTGIIKEVKCG
ncbi:MAG TPA: I78 family peptidase inhibitor [Caulobacteraceae bacterium]